MCCFMTLNVENIKNHIIVNNFDEKKIFAILKEFDEKSLELLLLIIEKENLEFYLNIKNIVEKIKQSNIDYLVNTYLDDNDNFDYLFDIYSNISKVREHIFIIFATLKSLSKTEILALLHLSKMKGDTSLSDAIIKADDKINETLLSTFLDDVLIKYEKMIDFGDLDDLDQLYNLEECFVLSDILLDENFGHIDVVKKEVRIAISNHKKNKEIFDYQVSKYYLYEKRDYIYNEVFTSKMICFNEEDNKRTKK